MPSEGFLPLVQLISALRVFQRTSQLYFDARGTGNWVIDRSSRTLEQNYGAPKCYWVPPPGSPIERLSNSEFGQRSEDIKQHLARNFNTLSVVVDDCEDLEKQINSLCSEIAMIASPAAERMLTTMFGREKIAEDVSRFPALLSRLADITAMLVERARALGLQDTVVIHQGDAAQIQRTGAMDAVTGLEGGHHPHPHAYRRPQRPQDLVRSVRFTSTVQESNVPPTLKSVRDFGDLDHFNSTETDPEQRLCLYMRTLASFFAQDGFVKFAIAWAKPGRKRPKDPPASSDIAGWFQPFNDAIELMRKIRTEIRRGGASRLDEIDRDKHDEGGDLPSAAIAAGLASADALLQDLRERFRDPSVAIARRKADLAPSPGPFGLNDAVAERTFSLHQTLVNVALDLANAVECGERTGIENDANAGHSASGGIASPTLDQLAHQRLPAFPLEVWKSLKHAMLTQKDLVSKGIATSGVTAGNAVYEIRQILGKGAIVTVHGRGYMRPDSPPPTEPE